MNNRARGLLILISVCAVLGDVTQAFAKKKPAPPVAAPVQVETHLLNAEGFAVQAQVEEMVTRRISLELGTRLEKSSFNVSTMAALVENDSPISTPLEKILAERPLDLGLGELSPDELVSPRADLGGLRSVGQGYDISSVTVSVGLSDEVTEETRKKTEEWLKSRITGEFGAAGKSIVSTIQRNPAPIAKPEPTGKNLWQRLQELQGLAGQILMGFALLAAVVLWRLLDKKQEAAPAPLQVSSSPPEPQAEAEKETEKVIEPPYEEALDIASSPSAEKIRQVAHVLPGGVDPLVLNWCQAGDDGKRKLVVFLESIAGTPLPLKIPRDFTDELPPLFEEVAAMSTPMKLGLLKQCYWDLVSFKSVGPEAMTKPFAYLAQLRQDGLQKLLMDRNPRMKAVVALNMPANARDQYVGTLGGDEKRALLEEALKIENLPLGELRELDTSLRGEIQSSDQGGKELNLMPMILKLISSLKPVEEIKLLGNIAQSQSGNPGLLESLKPIYPSLAFLDQWTAQALGVLFQFAGSDEIVALLKVKPEWEERVLNVAALITAEVVRDDLRSQREFSREDLEDHLKKLDDRLKNLVDRKEIDLAQAFHNDVGDGKDLSSESHVQSAA